MALADHSPAVQEALASAGLSRRSELLEDQAERALQLANGLTFASEDKRRSYIMDGPDGLAKRRAGRAARRRQRRAANRDALDEKRERRDRRYQTKEGGMAASTTTKKPRKRQTAAKGSKASNGAKRTKLELSAKELASVAKLRREGGTWKQVYGDLLKRPYGGCRKMRELLEAGGYDRFGRKDGKGTSKAHGWGSGKDDGVQPNDTGRKPRAKKSNTASTTKAKGKAGRKPARKPRAKKS